MSLIIVSVYLVAPLARQEQIQSRPVDLLPFASPWEHSQSSPAQEPPGTFVYVLGHWCLLFRTNQINGLCPSNPEGEIEHTHIKSEWSIFLLKVSEKLRKSFTRQHPVCWLNFADKHGAGGWLAALGRGGFKVKVGSILINRLCGLACRQMSVIFFTSEKQAKIFSR